MKKNDIVKIKITGMTTEGNGVGRFNDMAVFVPLTAVSDVVNVKIVKVLKNFAYGIVDSIIAPSDTRVQNDCEVFKQCGGCSFRHISYNAELEIKNNYVKDALNRIGKLDVTLEDICGADNINEYRNKAQYPVATIDDKVVCGFYSSRSHRVVPFTHCKLQPNVFGEIVQVIIDYVNSNKIMAYDEKTQKGLLRHIYLRQGSYTDEIMVCLVVTKIDKQKFLPLVKILTDTFKNVKSIVLNLNDKNTNVILGKRCVTIFGEDEINSVMCNNKIKLSPLSFYQVNTKQAEKLYNIAKEYANLSGNEFLVDLYCGTGTIGLSMAHDVKNLVGVEIVGQAVNNAMQNAVSNNINNAQFICSDAGEYAQKLVKINSSPDVVIVDPPRKGCDKNTLDAIIAMNPDRLVYISCNPATLARDAAYLVENGYIVKRAKAVDLFPRTTHVETVVLITRTEK